MHFKKAINFILNKQEKELPVHLAYHSIVHVMDVYNAAEQIGKQEGITAADMKLLLTAAAYHDSGFIETVKGHEERSCLLAQETLPAFGYSPVDIEKICGMIRTTQIPQTPKNHLEEIIADADLDYLGRDDFFTTGENLFTELLTLGVIKDENDWNNLQVRFMESHHYFTKTSVKLRKAKKQQHLKQVKTKLKN